MKLRTVFKNILNLGSYAYIIITVLQAVGFLPFPLLPEANAFLMTYYQVLSFLSYIVFFACSFWVGYRFALWRNREPLTVKETAKPEVSLLHKLGFQSLLRQDLLAIQPQLNFNEPKPIHFKSWNETEAGMKKQLIDNEGIYEIMENIARVLDDWNGTLDRASRLMLELDSGKIYLCIQAIKKYCEKLREIGFLS